MKLHWSHNGQFRNNEWVGVWYIVTLIEGTAKINRNTPNDFTRVYMYETGFTIHLEGIAAKLLPRMSNTTT